MFSKLGKGVAWFLTIITLNISSYSAAAQQQINDEIPGSTDISFLAKPANCVALRQGRTCFAMVSLFWQVPDNGNFCIYEKASNKALQCWKNRRESKVQFEFESSENVAYQLISIDDNTVIAETTIDVSWVHKAAPRKRRWRLF